MWYTEDANKILFRTQFKLGVQVALPSEPVPTIDWKQIEIDGKWCVVQEISKMIDNTPWFFFLRRYELEKLYDEWLGKYRELVDKKKK